MSQKRIQQIEQRFDRIKRALLEIGPMRPGSLTRHQWIDLSIEHSRLTYSRLTDGLELGALRREEVDDH